MARMGVGIELAGRDFRSGDRFFGIIGRMKKALTAAILASFSTGCFTLVHSPFPETEQVRAPANAPGARVEGYYAEAVQYTPIYGSETRYAPGWSYGRRFLPGRYETITTEAVIAKRVPTSAYLKAAKRALEDSGIVVDGPQSEYCVSVEFMGPSTPEGTVWRAAAIDCCSLLFALYDATMWHADLRIREISTGRVVFAKVLEQEYECCAFSPLWMFALQNHEVCDGDYQDQWCLKALTQRTAAEAAAFLATLAKGEDGK